MKKIFVIIFTLFAFHVTHAQDEITQLSGPTEVKTGKKITVNVSYVASEAREILVFLQLNEDPWTNVGATKVKVSGGKGTVEAELTTDNAASPGSNYKISSVLVPKGKAWPERLDQKVQTDVTVIK
ncbi:hypothetical protein [Aestuariivivens sediminis]|uniref:hypothetical protein n=1 Tax=Aestuariivivens sediminis TaxID=2913557 RepID=UPI001F580A8C|nr:hypothetical protein [Aestuariivivens sediminis]